jgi:hypothetical protein
VTLLFGAGTGGVLVLRWLWERVNLFSELSAIAVSLALAPVILWSVEAEWLRLLLMAAASTAVVIAVTLLTPPTAEPVRVAFFRRVDPPGLWRGTARAAGADPSRPVRRLRRGVWATLVTSASVYLVLVGLGRLLLPDPAGGGGLPWLLTGAGLALCPLWLRELARPDEP